MAQIHALKKISPKTGLYSKYDLDKRLYSPYNNPAESRVLGKDEVASSNLAISSTKTCQKWQVFFLFWPSFCIFGSLILQSNDLICFSVNNPSVRHARKPLFHKAFRALFASASRQLALKPYTFPMAFDASMAPLRPLS